MADDRPAAKVARSVAYFFDEEMCNYNYGGGNPMRPHRHRLTTNLVKGYELDKKMRIVRPEPRTRDEIMHFHADGAPRGGLGRPRRRSSPLAAARRRRLLPAACLLTTRLLLTPPLRPARLPLTPRRLRGLPDLGDAREPGGVHDAGGCRWGACCTAGQQRQPRTPHTAGSR